MRSTVIFAGIAQIELNQHSENSVLFSTERSWGWLSKKMSAPPDLFYSGVQVDFTIGEQRNFKWHEEIIISLNHKSVSA